MKGNPIKLGSIASKSAMKLKDKVMKMKKEAAMKMKKESMAKMKEAMAKMKKDPMMMKKGSPAKKVLDQVKVVGKRTQGTDVTEEYKTKGNKATRDHIAKGGKVFKNDAGQIVLRKDATAMKMKKGEPMKIKGPTKPKKDKIGGGFKVKQIGPNSFKLENKTLKREQKISKKRFEELGGTVLPASVFENTGKQSAPKNPVAMKKGQPMKQKMNMVKGPDGKMVPDFAVDGKGANDMKKSGAKMKKKSPNKGRFIKAMKAGDFKSAGKILKREGKAILSGTKRTRTAAANPTLEGDIMRFGIGYDEEKKRQAKKPVKITRRKPFTVAGRKFQFKGKGDSTKS